MKYNNSTRVSGVHPIEATPLDDRLYVSTEAEIRAMSGVEPFPTVMYDGMVVQFADTRRKYIWIESPAGLMPVGHTYPVWYDDIYGHNYANKTYNFVLYDDILKTTLTFSSSALPGLKIPASMLPYKILRDMGSANVMLKSSATSYTRTEFPDSITFDATGILIILDPKPLVGEIFKITLF